MPPVPKATTAQTASQATPPPIADEKKAEKARQNLACLKDIAAAAAALDAVWEPSGFYNEQDPALALALHDALVAYREGKP